MDVTKYLFFCRLYVVILTVDVVVLLQRAGEQVPHPEVRGADGPNPWPFPQGASQTETTSPAR